MSIDTNGVSGIGIEFTEEMVDTAIEHGVFTEDDWFEDEYECIDRLRLAYQIAGNAYSGHTKWYLFVSGDTLKDINKNADKFVNRLSRYGIIVDKDRDLKVIEDFYIS